jgi:hypothetical protein
VATKEMSQATTTVSVSVSFRSAHGFMLDSQPCKRHKSDKDVHIFSSRCSSDFSLRDYLSVL